MPSLSPIAAECEGDAEILSPTAAASQAADECCDEDEYDMYEEVVPCAADVDATCAAGTLEADADAAEKLAELREDKCFLEYRTAELEEELNAMKAQAMRGDREDASAIQRLENEIGDYKEGIEEARMALEATLEEKRSLDERLRSTEAVFTERKRNFDHIITIFGEEKKSLQDQKNELEDKLSAAQDELRAARAGGVGGGAGASSAEPTAEAAAAAEEAARRAGEQEKELESLRTRVDELETMLGLSGLARQSLEKKAEALEGEVEETRQRAAEEAECRASEGGAKDAELAAKTKEIADLKLYVGKKSLQWEQFKDDAILAKKQLEEKFDERCGELDTLQTTLSNHKAQMESMQGELETKDEELEASRAYTATASTELMSLLEEKEALIEELTLKVSAVPDAATAAATATAAAADLTNLSDRNKALEDEVMGLKSLVFKLERRAAAGRSLGGVGSGGGVAQRTPSPSSAMARSLSNSRPSLRFPSPAAARGGGGGGGGSFGCASPSGRAGRKLTSATRGSSPSGRGGSPAPRGYSPGATARRASLSGQAVAAAGGRVSTGHRQPSRMGSPMSKGPMVATYQTPAGSGLYPMGSPSGARMLGGRKGMPTTPLASRSVNAQVGEI